MNQLLSIRTNIVYARKKKQDENAADEYKKFHELIFLVDKPGYKRTNEGEIIRERSIEEVRFTVSNEAFGTMIRLLTELKDVKEEELDD